MITQKYLIFRKDPDSEEITPIGQANTLLDAQKQIKARYEAFLAGFKGCKLKIMDQNGLLVDEYTVR